jgi:hypothetical protein
VVRRDRCIDGRRAIPAHVATAPSGRSEDLKHVHANRDSPRAPLNHLLLL